MAALDDLEPRVAALEAAQSDYRAVLAAINALGANQREHASEVGALRTEVGALRTEVTEVGGELRDFRRSAEESLAEVKDLIIGLRDG